MKAKILVMLSGGGSTLLNLIQNNIQIAHVITNHKCGGINIAQEHGIPSSIIHHNNHDELQQHLEAGRYNLIVLAGYMRILPDFICQKWTNIINLHPSILPAFKGIDVINKAYANKACFIGSTVHRVISELDAGDIIGQSCLPILDSDTDPELELLNRVKSAEKMLLTECIKYILDGVMERKIITLKLEDRNAIISLKLPSDSIMYKY